MSKEPKKTVMRGDIFYADLSPVVGSEQGGVRPVLIIQNNVGNHYSPTVIIASITSCLQKSRMPTHVFITGEEYGLREDSMVLMEQIRTIDRLRFREYIGHLDLPVMEQVDLALAVSVGLSVTKAGINGGSGDVEGSGSE